MMILRDLRKKIEEVINQSGLPIDAIYFVLKDIYNEVAEIYSQQMLKEDAEALANKESSENKEEHNEDAAQ